MPNLIGATVKVIPMDGAQVSTRGEYLRTDGVADCLIVVLHYPARSVGGLAHISYPHCLGRPGATNDDKIRNHVKSTCGVLLDGMSAGSSQDIEALLWRGFGFGTTLPTSQPDVLGHIFEDYCQRVIDLLGHFAPEDIEIGRKKGDMPQPSLPYDRSSTAIYNPTSGIVWFPDTLPARRG